ncbi:maleylpyruvate isomerase family mycothiol-dependent enzyme [Propioniciclava coleopterorum]|uniref:Maleylpyruvate isomerase family mycothiol-dependent enzyme n=1 Tax=Propioniciclava coleopterorum TaxID=2714937 RepID=A0A6G7Y8V2_9ACTN|nr:maleylpyruvate isomerase N-terminal domain-containing protein [Propioniciclava coleopterorum]QIK73078.1 maleylpyruvate isomerase family mycothiol-dependent enzyme [Propioniciclava coleopterorum]
MSEVQDFRAMGEALGDAGAILRGNAGSAGLDAPVPTAPGWAVRDLVAHQGMVHRWATGYLTRGPRREAADVLAEAAASTDLLDWFDDGLVDLLNAFASLPVDAELRFFLPDAPPPRDAWLRRQVHETSVHAIDAMAARLGRLPAASELWLDPRLAADGVDELLTGFVARDGLLRADPPRRVRFDATDVGRSWLLEARPDGTTVTRVDAGADADATVAGTARELYLRVWNRGEGGTASDPGFWDAWRAAVKVAWS